MDNNSLAHTKWECEYHLVFAPFCSLGEVGGVGAEPPQKLLAAAVIVQIVGTGSRNRHRTWLVFSGDICYTGGSKITDKSIAL